ncbi:MAG: DEAD/DEAH box helicase family protein [Candidatus Cloacimonetes bacterium]|nr:DEAD/DEAH box helicase family protein [Candidatus Cloacimonadota bacterium]
MTKQNNKYPGFDFTVVDIETTGLEPEYNDIIEIGACKFRNNQKVDEFQSFINIGGKLPPNIITLTGITDDNLSGAPSEKIVLKGFQDFVGSDTLCFHNAYFDLKFLNVHLQNAGLRLLFNDYFDTLQIARIFTPHIKSHSLEKMCEYFDIRNESAHRADSDAMATGQLFIKLIEFVCDNVELDIISQIESISSEIDFNANFTEFIKKLRNFLTKTSLQRQRDKESEKFVFFPKNNFVPSVKSGYSLPKIFRDEEILVHFTEGGSFDENFEKYEFRQGQIDMVSWITEAYQNGKTLLIEAGTGVGKSFAYLVPSVIYSKFAKQKIIVSTNTKNLQEQLFYKDIPTIQAVTQIGFSAALLKGRNNYLCLRKWHNIMGNPKKYLSDYERKHLLRLIIWTNHTKTGDIEENHSFHRGRSSLWSKIASDGTACHGRNCPYYDECFTIRIRRNADESNIVVINHSLLVSDAVTENSVLGEYDHLVIDEAHNLPQVSARQFGFSLSVMDILTLTKNILTTGEFQYGISKNIKVNAVKSVMPDNKKQKLKSLADDLAAPLDNLEANAKEFFTELDRIVIENGSYGKLRFTNLALFKSLKSTIDSINEALALLYKRASLILGMLEKYNEQNFPNYEENVSDLQGVQDLIEELQAKFQNLFAADFDNYAYWLETQDKEINTKYLPRLNIVCAPINVDEDLFEFFWSKLETCVLTSATLAIREKFKFYKNMTGLDRFEPENLMEFIASSPFDYDKQIEVLIPKFLPEPRDKYYAPQALSLIKEILDVHVRGTLALFTSYKDLHHAYDSLADSTMENDVTLLAQGKTGSRNSILNTFRQEENSVLLGTKSFWEGVDVKGKSLEILILFRLPFLVPTEPIVEATLDYLKKEGKNSFMEYTLPLSLLSFKQGFGRLIRNKTDKGVVIILDTRTVKKRYGKYFLKVLPKEPKIVDSDLALVDHITNWFDKSKQ